MGQRKPGMKNGDALQHLHKLLSRLGNRQAVIAFDHDLTGWKLFVDLNLKKAVLVFRNTVIRNKGNAQTDAGQVN